MTLPRISPLVITLASVLAGCPEGGVDPAFDDAGGDEDASGDDGALGDGDASGADDAGAPGDGGASPDGAAARAPAFGDDFAVTLEVSDDARVAPAHVQFTIEWEAPPALTEAGFYECSFVSDSTALPSYPCVVQAEEGGTATVDALLPAGVHDAYVAFDRVQGTVRESAVAGAVVSVDVAEGTPPTLPEAGVTSDLPIYPVFDLSVVPEGTRIASGVADCPNLLASGERTILINSCTGQVLADPISSEPSYFSFALPPQDPEESMGTLAVFGDRWEMGPMGPGGSIVGFRQIGFMAAQTRFAAWIDPAAPGQGVVATQPHLVRALRPFEGGEYDFDSSVEVRDFAHTFESALFDQANDRMIVVASSPAAEVFVVDTSSAPPALGSGTDLGIADPRHIACFPSFVTCVVTSASEPKVAALDLSGAVPVVVHLDLASPTIAMSLGIPGPSNDEIRLSPTQAGESPFVIQLPGPTVSTSFDLGLDLGDYTVRHGTPLGNGRSGFSLQNEALLMARYRGGL